jgi:hypothetical protein
MLPIAIAKKAVGDAVGWFACPKRHVEEIQM